MCWLLKWLGGTEIDFGSVFTALPRLKEILKFINCLLGLSTLYNIPHTCAALAHTLLAVTGSHLSQAALWEHSYLCGDEIFLVLALSLKLPRLVYCLSHIASHSEFSMANVLPLSVLCQTGWILGPPPLSDSPQNGLRCNSALSKWKAANGCNPGTLPSTDIASRGLRVTSERQRHSSFPVIWNILLPSQDQEDKATSRAVSKESIRSLFELHIIGPKCTAEERHSLTSFSRTTNSLTLLVDILWPSQTLLWEASSCLFHAGGQSRFLLGLFE